MSFILLCWAYAIPTAMILAGVAGLCMVRRRKTEFSPNYLFAASLQSPSFFLVSKEKRMGSLC